MGFFNDILFLKGTSGMKFFAAYMILISLISCIVTIYDKRQAKAGKWRIPEKSLFLLSAMGGSAAMLATMKIIRHKTKHKRFMIGIPLIILVQCALLVIFIYFHPVV